MSKHLQTLLQQVRSCTLCKDKLEPRPVVQVSSASKIVLIGQAPGRKVLQTGIAWNDASGKRLRDWLGVDKKTFYNPDVFAFLPLAFCYPGKGKSGDKPPPKICAKTWHQALLSQIKAEPLMILIGAHSQSYYLNDKLSLTHRVSRASWYLPKCFPLPHPSPRNTNWLKQNPQFERETIPELKKCIQQILSR